MFLKSSCPMLIYYEYIQNYINQDIYNYPNTKKQAQMLAHLITQLRYRIGFHTNHLQSIMRDFKPNSEQNIISTLLKIGKRKQYVRPSPLTQSFIDRIEYYLLKDKNSLTANTLYIYQLAKHLNFLTPRFKYGLLRNLTNQMQRIIDQNLIIRNNQLQVLLWFVYRQFPLYRQTKFQQIASDHTLKLFQILQFMNKQKKIPIWQPYIRITTMLKALGHQIQTRKDMTQKDIAKVDYHYYPYITSVVQSAQQLFQFRKKYQIHQPLLIYLCNSYIDKDKARYDQYLQHIQVIDNQVAGEQIDKIVDPLTWQDYAQLISLYAKACQNIDYDPNLAYKINDMFWRLCETKNVQLESGVYILNILTKTPDILGDYESGFISRILDKISDAQSIQLKFLPGKAYTTILKSVKQMHRLTENQKKQMYQCVSKNVSNAVLWEEGQKNQIAGFFKENDIKLDETTDKFLNKK